MSNKVKVKMLRTVSFEGKILKVDAVYNMSLPWANVFMNDGRAVKEVDDKRKAIEIESNKKMDVEQVKKENEAVEKALNEAQKMKEASAKALEEAEKIKAEAEKAKQEALQAKAEAEAEAEKAKQAK